ncbi:MAG: alkaline phosphatase D family protein [Sporichthyaceae bacterium]
MSSAFPHGVASFDPTSSTVLLWTRVEGAVTARWLVARDPLLREVVRTGDARTGPEHDSTIVVDADDLEAGTTYWYRFIVDGAHSPIGRTRTLPGAGSNELVLGLVSCANYSVAPLGVYRALSGREVDLVVHLGDYVYDSEGHSGRRAHEPPHRVRTLADYRARIAQMRRDPDCQALHQRHPMATVVDDHDLADNAWRGGAKTHDDAEDGPWPQRADAAMTARSEWLPTRRRAGDDVTHTWRSFPVGDLAELVLLDSRLHGRDLQAGDPGALPLQAEERTILGAVQRAWAFERIADLSRPWCLLANGVVVNEIVLRPPFPRLVARLLPQGYAAYGGELLRDDQWDGYPAERRRLVQALAERRNRGGASVLLSGDVHSSWAFTGPRGDDGQAVAVEVVTPSVSSAPLGRTRWPVVWRLLDRAVRSLEHVDFVDVTNRGFVLLHVSRDRVSAGWHWVDPYDPGKAPEVEPARWLAVTHSDPRWLEAEPLPDPVRVGQVDLPARPGDVRAARRHHRRRRFAGLAAVTLAGAAALSPLARALHRGGWLR